MRALTDDRQRRSSTTRSNYPILSPAPDSDTCCSTRHTPARHRRLRLIQRARLTPAHIHTRTGALCGPSHVTSHVAASRPSPPALGCRSNNCTRLTEAPAMKRAATGTGTIFGPTLTSCPINPPPDGAARARARATHLNWNTCQPTGNPIRSLKENAVNRQQRRNPLLFISRATGFIRTCDC